jgi:hypothetical protein
MNSGRLGDGVTHRGCERWPAFGTILSIRAHFDVHRLTTTH